MEPLDDLGARVGSASLQLSLAGRSSAIVRVGSGRRKVVADVILRARLGLEHRCELLGYRGCRKIEQT